MKEMRRVWKNPGFWFAVLLGVFSMLYPHMDTYLFKHSPLEYFASGDFLYFMMMPLRYGLAKLFLPMIAVFPSAIFLAEDQRQREHLLAYYRWGAWRYMRHRMGQAVFSAVLAAALGLLIYTAFAAVACPWHDNIVSSWRTLEGYPFQNWINRYEGMPFLVLQLFCLCASAAMWALVGFSIACFTANSGIDIGGTFLAHYGVSWFLTRVLHASEWSPMVLQAPSNRYVGSIGMIAVRLGVWLALALVLALGCAKCFLIRMEES